MGFYIQGPRKGKVKHILNKYVSVLVDHTMPDFDKCFDLTGNDGVLICVIDNGSLEAAAVAVDRDEFHYFLNDRSGRPTQWILSSERNRIFEDVGFSKAKV